MASVGSAITGSGRSATVMEPGSLNTAARMGPGAGVTPMPRTPIRDPRTRPAWSPAAGAVRFGLTIGVASRRPRPPVGGRMILATTTVEDYDRFEKIFSTKGAEKRREHGS